MSSGFLWSENSKLTFHTADDKWTNERDYSLLIDWIAACCWTFLYLTMCISTGQVSVVRCCSNLNQMEQQICEQQMWSVWSWCQYQYYRILKILKTYWPILEDRNTHFTYSWTTVLLFTRIKKGVDGFLSAHTARDRLKTALLHFI